MDTTQKFALIAIGKEARSSPATGNSIMSKEGERFWIETDPEGWVSASGSRLSWRGPDGNASSRLKTFGSIEEAQEFAKQWKPHPWWVIPKAFEVVVVEPLYERLTGYKMIRVA